MCNWWDLTRTATFGSFETEWRQHSHHYRILAIVSTFEGSCHCIQGQSLIGSLRSIAELRYWIVKFTFTRFVPFGSLVGRHEPHGYFHSENYGLQLMLQLNSHKMRCSQVHQCKLQWVKLLMRKQTCSCFSYFTGNKILSLFSLGKCFFADCNAFVFEKCDLILGKLPH